MTRLADEPLPISGEVHFWRLDPGAWAPALDAVADMGISHVATYLSWRRHESRAGVVDFTSPRLDVLRFLDLCAERGLGVHLKPGPWICAEEVGGGLPDWVLTQRDLLALDHTGKWVLGYNPPFKHSVPSYASPKFRRLAAGWLERVWHVIGDHARPGGIIEAVQLDNEPSVAFQDAMYRADYSPAALDQFRDFVLSRYGSLAAVGDAWASPISRRDAITAPVPPPGRTPSQRERDWADFHEHYISDYLAFLHQTICSLGGEHLTASVNLNTHPVRGFPQNGQHIAQTLRDARPDASIIVGEDHYFVPPIGEGDLAQLELGAALGRHSATDLVWSPELQAGIWRSPGEHVTYPDPLDGELAAWWGLSLAFGYQGFNLYMLVDRENWQYAPIDSTGHLTGSGECLKDLIAVLAKIPGLARYRVVPAVNLAWDRDILTAAYTHLGTQAQPRERWTSSETIRPWEQTLELATRLTAAGLPYTLCTAPDEIVPGLPVIGPAGLPARWDESETMMPGPLPPGPVTADQTGVQARILAGPDGTKILVVVAWQRDRGTPSTRLCVTGAQQAGLIDLRSGRRFPITDDNAAEVPLPSLGVRIFGFYD